MLVKMYVDENRKPLGLDIGCGNTIYSRYRSEEFYKKRAIVIEDRPRVSLSLLLIGADNFANKHNLTQL